METTPAQLLLEIRAKASVSLPKLAQLLGTSLVSISRWERGVGCPSAAQTEVISQIHQALSKGDLALIQGSRSSFSSRGIRTRMPGQSVLGDKLRTVSISDRVFPPILSRLVRGRVFDSRGEDAIAQLVAAHVEPAPTTIAPFETNISAGKNTYTYDAHTYHTKVPPQGIAELLAHYLPSGGLVLDPFAGSGMTGVAARAVGCDCILNELSPAASFIANRFTASSVVPTDFEAAVHVVLEELADIRRQLYSTTCRECGRVTELLYVVWSYRVICNYCAQEFQLWDSCRKYGRVVREHKILTHFPCPQCGKELRKAALTRTVAEPVLVGYKCCGSRQQEVTHAPSKADVDLIRSIEAAPPLREGFFPRTLLGDGVNLRQPKKHGLDSVDKFYTSRNLAALSQLWNVIHRIEAPELAAHVAFVFTSLYQRVTRMSEFRFWGGSGNTAHFNVPFIFDEPNVFVTFQRKARTIQDHLEATAATYSGDVVVVNDSATALNYLPPNSVDLIFTDPPFGANINYSEMNFLWESWLGSFTDNTNEAIINRVQGKGVAEYENLMTKSLQECYRVLREGHWLLLVFMNSSRQVWEALRNSINVAGFEIARMDIFDKQHGTFKQFVSDNTAGMDLVLHCMKPVRLRPNTEIPKSDSASGSVTAFLETRSELLPTNVYLHVGRAEEVDFRTLYSEWLSQSFRGSGELLDFLTFRRIVQNWIEGDSTVEAP
jgi:DNA modification methylase/predicted RNA-binding Zn-ribbon protein involved in translation (DUF1610 family)